MCAQALGRQVAAIRLLVFTPRKVVRIVRFQHCNGRYCEEADGTQAEPGTGEYSVHYNPAAYRWVRQGTATPCGTDEEEPPSPTLTTHFRQQSNPYSVSSSRSHYSTQNTLLNLAFGRTNSSSKAPPPSVSNEDPPPDIKCNPRAFQRCRPEYSTMSYDASQQTPPITADEAFLLLHKVSVLKGSMEPHDVVQFLEKLSQLPPELQPLAKGDTRFTMLLRYGVENLQHFSNTQLLKVLQAFVSLCLPAAHTMLGLYETELVRRADGMEPRQLLLAADLWRCLGRRVPRFLEKLYGCASVWPWARLGPAELVQFIYVIGEGRHCTTPLLLTLELQLLHHLDLLTAEEVGTICLGFFKSQSCLSTATVNRLVSRACVVVQDISDFGLVNVLKLLRFSYLDHLGLLRSLGTEIPRRAPQMGIQGLMHVALACSALHYRDDSVLLAIAERLPALLPHCRSKDAGKLLWAFGTLGFTPNQVPGLFPSLAQTMHQREAEFRRFPEHVLTGLMGMAFVGLFPTSLLTFALSPEFVSLATIPRQLDLKKDLFTLDATVGLEVPGWTGPRISHTLAEEVTQQLWNFALQDVCIKPEVLEAESLLQELLGGEGFVLKRMILPHTRSIDLEIHLDAAGNPLPLLSETKSLNPEPISPSLQGLEEGRIGVMITEDLLAQLTNIKGIPVKSPQKPPHHPACSPMPSEAKDEVFTSGVELTERLIGALKSPNPLPPSPQDPPGEAVQRLAVQVSNRNQYCYRSQQLLGLHKLKRRQLALSGYRVVELPPWEWLPLLCQSHAEKMAYLRSKIFSNID